MKGFIRFLCVAVFGLFLLVYPAGRAEAVEGDFSYLYYIAGQVGDTAQAAAEAQAALDAQAAAQAAAEAQAALDAQAAAQAAAEAQAALEAQMAAAQAAQAAAAQAQSVDLSFDPVYYMTQNPDAAAAFGNDAQLLYEHYLLYGLAAGKYPNAAAEQAGLLPDAATMPAYLNFVDVDITGQTVTYFENGIAVMSSPCVTGCTNRGRGTPRGNYAVMRKVPGKYLVGPTWKCWVDYWMQFTPGHIGLHDANWRKSFGGEIYKSSGSHGCVNLPKDFARQLYDKVQVGTPVIVR